MARAVAMAVTVAVAGTLALALNGGQKTWVIPVLLTIHRHVIERSFRFAKHREIDLHRLFILHKAMQRRPFCTMGTG
jgi:hypothetical protein